MPTPQEPFTIAIPGIQDIIRIPALESKQLKRERYERYKNHLSPIPEALNWVPHLINRLDNAQDLIITALNLGLPIFRALGPRVLPWLGWALLGSDLLNITNSLLSVLAAGRTPKIHVLGQLLRGMGGRQARTAAAEAFLQTGTPWLPFLLQAGQVLRDWTGTGLQLGGIFGGVSDAFWNTIRLKEFGTYRIEGPPPSDPLAKAANYLLDSSLFGYIADAGNSEDIGLDLLAQAAGQEIIHGRPDANLTITRRNDVEAHPMTLSQPWSPSTLALLDDLHIVPDPSAVPGVRGVSHPTFGDHFRVGIGAHAEFEEWLAKHTPATDAGYALSVLAQDAALDNWEAYGGKGLIDKVHSPIERMIGVAIEVNAWPRWLVPNPDGPLRYRPNAFDPQCLDVDPCNVRWLLNGPGVTPAYPPPAGDVNSQLRWWLKYCLLLWCGTPIDMPIWQATKQNVPYPIIARQRTAFKWGLYSVVYACLICFGNAWRKWCPPRGDEERLPYAAPRCPHRPDTQPQLVDPFGDPARWAFTVPTELPGLEQRTRSYTKPPGDLYPLTTPVEICPPFPPGVAAP